MTRMTEAQFETTRDQISLNVWEIWTQNGLGLDVEDIEQTNKSAADAVTNTWQDGISSADWQAAALAHLGA